MPTNPPELTLTQALQPESLTALTEFFTQFNPKQAKAILMDIQTDYASAYVAEFDPKGSDNHLRPSNDQVYLITLLYRFFDTLPEEFKVKED